MLQFCQVKRTAENRDAVSWTTLQVCWQPITFVSIIFKNHGLDQTILNESKLLVLVASLY